MEKQLIKKTHKIVNGGIETTKVTTTNSYSVILDGKLDYTFTDLDMATEQYLINCEKYGKEHCALTARLSVERLTEDTTVSEILDECEWSGEKKGCDGCKYKRFCKYYF